MGIGALVVRLTLTMLAIVMTIHLPISAQPAALATVSGRVVRVVRLLRRNVLRGNVLRNGTLRSAITESSGGGEWPDSIWGLAFGRGQHQPVCTGHEALGCDICPGQRLGRW